MKETILVALLLQVLFTRSEVALNQKLHNHKEMFETFVCPEPNGVFPSETCSDYYLCVEGVPYVQHCPGDSIFDPQTQVCLPPGANSCQGVTTTSSTTTTTQSSTYTSSSTTSSTITTPAVFTCPSSSGFYPVPESPCSNLYYTCISGVPYLSTCPGGSIFDPVALICVSPESASCSSTFQCPSDSGSFPIAGACSNKFYTCVSGKSYELNCTENYVFDTILLKCVPSAEASC
ncbi:protein obstructor-E-like [Daphnia pulicaria]|uniref:protein obstructor-E-like n=1 Tax=Daphnia pulicaria TaxID=35523 RepID=UPI001EEBE484|nr:protein obstructor-E-like [Daphnia pulicaria]